MPSRSMHYQGPDGYNWGAEPYRDPGEKSDVPAAQDAAEPRPWTENPAWVQRIREGYGVDQDDELREDL